MPFDDHSAVHNDQNSLAERGQFALQAAQVGTWDLDIAHQRIWWDDRCKQLYGFDGDDIVPYQQVFQYLHPDDTQRVDQAVQWALNPQSSGLYDVQFRTIGANDSQLRWLHCRGRAFFDEQGVAYRFSGIAQDITQLIQARQELAVSERRFDNLIVDSPMATVIFVGRDMVVQTINASMLGIWGKDDSVTNKTLHEAMPELIEQPFLELLQHVYDTGEAYYNPEGKADIMMGGQLREFWFNFAYNPLRDSNGQIYGVINTAIDITVQVNAQRALKQTQASLQTSLDKVEQLNRDLASALTLTQESEAHLQLLRDTVPAMIFYLDKEQRYQSYNQVFMDWFGVDRTEIIGKTTREFIGEMAYQAILPYLNKAYAGEQVQFEIRAPTRMGEHRWLMIVYTPHRASDGLVQGVIVHVTDSTNRKTIELDNQLKTVVLDTSPLIIGIGPFDEVGEFDGAPSYNNAYTLNRLGWLTNQSKTFVDAIYPEDRQKATELLPGMIASGGGVAELRLWNEQTGQPFWVEWTVFVIKDPVSGKPIALATVSPDITERKRQQQQMEENNAILQQAIELADMGTWELDMTTGVTTYSERLKQLFEFTEGYIDNDQLYNPIHEADRARLEAAVARVSRVDSDGLLDEEYTIVTQRTGRQRIVRSQAKMYFSKENKPLKLIGSMRDLTDQRHVQWALEQQVQQRTAELATANEELAVANEELAANNDEYATLNKELAEANNLLIHSNNNLQTFAYVASHDLQEPLRKIQQFGDLLKNRFAGSVGDDLIYLERMQSAASRMSTLIKDLLDFSRISTRRDDSGPVSLDEVLKQVLSTLELSIQETGAQIQVDSLPTVSGDASQLTQLFQNLISNALKFHRPDVLPVITLKTNRVAADQLPETLKPTRQASAYYRLDVIDNGIGFEEKYRDRIFQVFQRLHSKNEFSGTGIGLAICEKVVANHGGAITANSQLGQGTTFSTYLPVD